MQSEDAADPIRFGGSSETERPLNRSMMRGFLNRCPACGSGKLFRSYIKPVDHCAACNEDYRPQRADDLPPYLVIFIVGHVALGGFMMTDLVFTEWSSWFHLAIWVPITLILSLLLLQPIKGAVIGLQWALKMHGFGGEGNEPDHGHKQDYP